MHWLTKYTNKEYHTVICIPWHMGTFNNHYSVNHRCATATYVYVVE